MRRLAISKWLFGGAAAAFVALAALPSTGWLARAQLRLLAGNELPGAAGLRSVADRPVGQRDEIDRRLLRTAARFPNDYPMQLAAALETAPDVVPFPTPGTTPAEATPSGGRFGFVRGGDVRALLPLRERFDDRASLHGIVLRLLCRGDLRLTRPEEKMVAARWQEGTSPAPTPDVLHLAEAEAAAGERLAPGNGYFPTMAAVALFEERRDADALAALHRAAAGATWNDYVADEVRARWALSDAAFGRAGASSRAAILAATLLPEASRIRQACRVAVALAIRREQAGDREGGFAIRRDVARCGALMRADAPLFIENLVGTNVTCLASVRSGGAKGAVYDGAPVHDGGPWETRAGARDAAYVAYLDRLGHPEEARWYLAERFTADSAQRVGGRGLTLSVFGGTSLQWLIAAWMLSLALLAAVGWTLVLGGVGAGMERWLARRPAARPYRARDWWTGSLAFCWFAAGAAMLSLAPIKELGTTLGIFAGLASDGGKADDPSYALTVGAFLLATAVLLVPWLVVGAASGRIRRSREAVSAGYARQMRVRALPTAAALLLAYLALSGVVLAAERSLGAQEAQMLNGEGRYFASLAGGEWPGPVPEPAPAGATPATPPVR